MTRVKLSCGVYGEGTVFSVEIARDADVEALQEKIAGVLSTEQHTVPPRLLALYLARKKEGEEVKWLKDDRHVKDFLRGGVSTEYEEMRPLWRLNKEELLGPNFEPGEEEIHVLVKLPPLEMPPTKKQIVDDGDIQQIDIQQMLELVRGLARATDLAEGTLLKTPPKLLRVNLARGLYVRQEYWDVYTILNKELANKAVKRVLLIGSPGTGKSVFGVFLLLLFMSEHKNVAYRPLHKCEELHYFTWNAENECYDVSLKPVRGCFYEGLFDGDEKGGAWGDNHFVHSYLFASPRTENYNEFVKEDCTTIYMNPWTTEECKKYVDKVVNPCRGIQPGSDAENEWFMRYNIIGGKPRLLFSETLDLDALVDKVESAIPATLNELKQVFHAIQTDGPLIYERSKHILFALFRNKENPSKCFIDFASGIIDCKVSARFKGESMDKIKSYCMTSSPLAQAWRGYLCERLLLEYAATSEILVRPLEGEDISAGSIKSLGPYKATSKIFHGASEIVAEECLYRPLAKNFPAIDGVLVVPDENLVIYLQATVSLKHSIQHEALKGVINILVKKQEFANYRHIFLFLVMGDTYDDFKKQRFKNKNNEDRKIGNDFEVEVKQYVGKIEKIEKMETNGRKARRQDETGSAAPSPSSHKRTRSEASGEESDGFSSEGDTKQRVGTKSAAKRPRSRTDTKHAKAPASRGPTSEGDTKQRGGTKNPKTPAKRRSSTKTSSRPKKRKASN